MRIDKVDVVGAFQVDNTAPLKLGALLSTVADANSAQIRQLNVPNTAPANIARFMVPMQGAVLQVGLDRVQLTLDPPDHIKSSPDEVFRYALAEAERLLAPVASQPWMKAEWAGAIVFAAIPTDTASLAEAARQAAAEVVKLELPGNLRTFQLQIGQEDDGFYKTFTVSGYEIRTAAFEFQAGQTHIAIDESNTTVDETGIGVVIDVNNRPDPKPSNATAFREVLEEAQASLKRMLQSLSLERTSS